MEPSERMVKNLQDMPVNYLGYSLRNWWQRTKGEGKGRNWVDLDGEKRTVEVVHQKINQIKNNQITTTTKPPNPYGTGRKNVGINLEDKKFFGQNLWQEPVEIISFTMFYRKSSCWALIDAQTLSSWLREVRMDKAPENGSIPSSAKQSGHIMHVSAKFHPFYCGIIFISKN